MALNTSNSTSTTIHHFTHQEHPLLEVNDNIPEFHCDGCKTTGIGKRYQCQKSCNFNLHPYCGRCPKKLISSFIHPGHELALVKRKPKSARRCNVCRYSVEGMFYRCNICDFEVHPNCTQLIQYLRHALDSAHTLELKPPPSSTINCNICHQQILNQWCYRCFDCFIDIHVECVGTFVASSLPPPESQSTSRYLPGVRPNHAPPSPFHPSLVQGEAAGFGAIPSFLTPSYGHSHSFGGSGASPYGLPPACGSMCNNAYQQQPAQMLAGAGSVLQQPHINYNIVPAAAAHSSTSTGAGMTGNKLMLSVLSNLASAGLSNVIFGSSDFDWSSLFN